MRLVKYSLASLAVIFAVTFVQPLNSGEVSRAVSQDEQYSLSVNVPLTVVDLVFTNKNGGALSLDIENGDINDFLEVKEDGEPQKVEFFESTDAKLNVLFLIDYSRQAVELSDYSERETWYGPLYLIEKLKKDDWIAIVLYDIKTEQWLEFTKNKTEAKNSIANLWRTTPSFSESNVSDAVLDVLDIVDAQKGRFTVILLGTGFDTFPRRIGTSNFFDAVIPRVKNSRATFYTIGIGGSLRARGYESMDNLMADSRLKELAKATGGRFYSPRFVNQFPGIFEDITARMRNQYTIGYYPTNRDFNGEKRKVEIKLKKGFDVNLDGKIDEKDKIEIYHKEEYYPGKEIG